VFGPNVSAGHKSVQIRSAYAPSQSRRSDGLAARIHYQQAVNSALRWRLIVQGSDVPSGQFESNFLQAELQWNFSKPTASSSWSQGLRADYRLTEGDNGADQFGLNYTVQNDFAPRWRAIGVLLANYQLGSEAADGTAFETRASIGFKLANGFNLALESFNGYGRSGNNGNFDEQNHRLGPALSGKLSANIGFYAGALFGISDAARNADYRLWFSHSF